MTHFAKIEEGIVTQVVVVSDEHEADGESYLNSLGLEGAWIQTSYNGTIRKIFAGIGYSYNDLLGIRKECALVTAYEIQGQYEIEHDAPAYLFWENVIKQLYELR
jgi:hypothetical protein